ncbi:MAG: hypothetical protein WBW92_03205 [Rhodanobacteraceae bacterium]
MKWQTFFAVFIMGMIGLQSNAQAASPSAGSFYELVIQIDNRSTTNSEKKYSSQLRQSINAAAIQHLTRACAQQHSDARVQTFTLVGLMRLDGVMRNPTLLPENEFTACVARQIDSVSFPLPPGHGKGWPVAMQIDSASGKVLYVSGDRQLALPVYRQRPATTFMPWIYTPVPPAATNVSKSCTVNVWVSIAQTGRVDAVDVANSSCSAKVTDAVEAAAGQWLYMGASGSDKVDTRDVRLSFSIRNKRFHVKL